MVATNSNTRFELPVIDPAALLPAPQAEPKPKKAPAKKKPAPKADPAVVPPAPVRTRPDAGPLPAFKLRLTVALGVAIPLLSLATSKIAGTLAGGGHYALAGFGAAIGVAVLAVSLSHLAWAVRDVTGSGPRASWALAVALDCSLVLCELVHVGAAGDGLDAVCWVMLVMVAGFSMVLNCHAFLNHKS